MHQWLCSMSEDAQQSVESQPKLADGKRSRVILDTNVFVAAGFNRRSHAARIVDGVRNGDVTMVWHDRTRDETEFILRKIPPLSWGKVAELFLLRDRYDGDLDCDIFEQIGDRDDRKFAALAAATGAVLITMDSDLLEERDRLAIQILKPFEFVE